MSYSEVDLKKQFDHMDKDKSGSIEKSELEELFTNCSISKEDKDNIISVSKFLLFKMIVMCSFTTPIDEVGNSW